MIADEDCLISDAFEAAKGPENGLILVSLLHLSLSLGYNGLVLVRVLLGCFNRYLLASELRAVDHHKSKVDGVYGILMLSSHHHQLARIGGEIEDSREVRRCADVLRSTCHPALPPSNPNAKPEWLARLSAIKRPYLRGELPESITTF